MNAASLSLALFLVALAPAASADVLDRRYHDFEKKHVSEETPRNAQGQMHGVRKFFSYDGHLLRTTAYILDERDGAEIEYFDSGKRRRETTYSHDVKNGPFREWTEDNKLVTDAAYKDDYLEGPYTVYWPNGHVKEVGFKKHESWHGTVKTYAESGTIESEEAYVNGDEDPNGASRKYDDLGSLSDETIRKDGKTKSLKTFYPGGRPKRTAVYDADGTIVSAVDWDESGLVVESTPYKNGDKHGRYTKTARGALIEEATYKAGYLDGPSRQFSADGVPLVKRTYKHGEIDGDDTEYFKNGKVKAAKRWRDGKLTGAATFYYSSGKTMCTANYADGVRDGKFECLYQDGDVMFRATYKDGEQESIVFYDRDGRKTVVFKDAEEMDHEIP